MSTIIHYRAVLVKLKQYDLPPHIRRWIATYLLDRTQQVKLGNNFSPPGHPKGGVEQGTLLGPKCFLVYINDLETPVPLYKYVDDSTLFVICHRKSESVLQHSVDIAARWTLHNDMKINSDKSHVARMSRTRENRVKRNYSSFYFRADSAARAVRLPNHSAADT